MIESVKEGNFRLRKKIIVGKMETKYFTPIREEQAFTPIAPFAEFKKNRRRSRRKLKKRKLDFDLILLEGDDERCSKMAVNLLHRVVG